MNLAEAWPYIERIAAKRLEHNKTERHVSKFGTEIEIIGVAGELAAHRFFALSEKLHTRFDGGADITINGWRIDVKGTRLDAAHRYLQWPHWKRIKADIILMTMVDINKRTALVVGYATRADILSSPVNIDPEKRDTPCHELLITNLRKASELYDITSHPKRCCAEGAAHSRRYRQATCQTA